MYRINPDNRQLVEEFRAHPHGPYGPELTKLVNRLRTDPKVGRYVVICLRRHQEWVLGELPARRGDGPRIYWDTRFVDLADAERHVFALRWKELTGDALTW